MRQHLLAQAEGEGLQPGRSTLFAAGEEVFARRVEGGAVEAESVQ